MLTLFQKVQQNDPAIWKFQRIVMGCRVVLIDLSEDCGLVDDSVLGPQRRTRLTSSLNDNSVPGSTQTAILASSGAEKPVVPE